MFDPMSTPFTSDETPNTQNQDILILKVVTNVDESNIDY
jgi:hypothetical protein